MRRSARSWRTRTVLKFMCIRNLSLETLCRYRFDWNGPDIYDGFLFGSFVHNTARWCDSFFQIGTQLLQPERHISLQVRLIGFYLIVSAWFHMKFKTRKLFRSYPVKAVCRSLDRTWRIDSLDCSTLPWLYENNKTGSLHDFLTDKWAEETSNITKIDTANE